MVKHGCYIIWKIYYMQSEYLENDKSACKVKMTAHQIYPPDDT